MEKAASRQTVYRSFRYKLAPTQAQETSFWQFAGVCRLVYNLALEQRREFWRAYKRQAGGSLNYISQGRQVTALRAEYDWIAATPANCLTQALRDLDRAYANFFAGRAGYPTPRVKGVSDSFRFNGCEIATRQLNGRWSAVKLPKMGWVKFRRPQAPRGIVKNATVIHDNLGWHVSFACEIDRAAPLTSMVSVGIDRGVASTLALSSGENLSLPIDRLAVLDRHLRSAQRVVARRKKGSKRRLKAVRRAAGISAKRARIRKDWHHKATTTIACRFGTVILEDLKVVNMTASAKGTVEMPGKGVRQKAGLNCAILNQGWGTFETLLAYKLEERGGTLIKVNPAYTSQTCSECETVDSQSRESQAVFACRHCGFRAHADHNAAINILRRSTASMCVEEGRQPSGEVRTKRGRKPAENHAEIAA